MRNPFGRVAVLALLLSAQVPGLAEETARPGQWTMHRAKDGSAHAVLGVVSDDGVAMLLIRCSRGVPDVSIKWGRYLGLDAAQVTTRLDGGERRTSSWRVSSNHDETIYSGDGVRYSGQLRAGAKLRAAVTPQATLPLLPGTRDEATTAVPLAPKTPSPVAVTFDLRGLARAIGGAADICGLRSEE